MRFAITASLGPAIKHSAPKRPRALQRGFTMGNRPSCHTLRLIVLTVTCADRQSKRLWRSVSFNAGLRPNQRSEFESIVGRSLAKTRETGRNDRGRAKWRFNAYSRAPNRLLGAKRWKNSHLSNTLEGCQDALSRGDFLSISRRCRSSWPDRTPAFPSTRRASKSYEDHSRS